MNRIPTTLIITMTALLVTPHAAAGSQWTSTTERGLTTAEGDLVMFSWSDDGNHTMADIAHQGTTLFGLELPMQDENGDRIPTDFHTQGNWLRLGHTPGPGNSPGPVGIKLHDVASLAGKVNCAPPEPIVPPEPVEPAGCMATFPDGSEIMLTDDGTSCEVQLPRDEDTGTPGPKLSWVGFNPQPEPPAVDGNMVTFVGENIHVGIV